MAFFKINEYPPQALLFLKMVLCRATPDRAPRVDLTHGQAVDFFDATVTVAAGKQLWPYSKGQPNCWKKSPHWGDIKRNRVALSLALNFTSGRMLRHKRLVTQLRSWVKDDWGIKAVSTPPTSRLRFVLTRRLVAGKTFSCWFSAFTQNF